HIGHAMQAIFFDVMRQFFKYCGYKTIYVRNYTDVDDKIIAKAEQLGISPLKLASEMIASTDRDMNAIGVEDADFQPKVSECIPEIIEMISVLIEKKAAYAQSNGDVYYRVRAKHDYGKLSNRNPDELRSGTRDLAGGQQAKEDELDFALWKADDTPDASWKSPWGLGRPGWHIECSVMAKKFLGDKFDIHGGGLDLIFPHHENEIAQSESANGCEYAQFWLHCGLMTINKQKMSKSLGNHIFIHDFLNDWPPEVLRLGILSHHYSSNIDFSLQEFQKSLGRLIYSYETLMQLDAIAKDTQAEVLPMYAANLLEKEFVSAMQDDLNTAMALAALNKAFKKAQEVLKTKDSPARQQSAWLLSKEIKKVSEVLGLFQEQPLQFLQTLKARYLNKISMTQPELDQLISDRKQARVDKKFAKSDAIRDLLLQKGIILKDTPSGTEWTIDPEQLEA
ncbi:MAG: cysteine--tRNA ligase, partial [Oligoflexales bacterium]|nr:cysteine--tRNA ligase [Oligoflexales bacterium]